MSVIDVENYLKNNNVPNKRMSFRSEIEQTITNNLDLIIEDIQFLDELFRNSDIVEKIKAKNLEKLKILKYFGLDFISL